VEIEIDAAVPSIVRGDPTRIAQVLYNLVNNAVKFTDNGVIRVEIKALSQDAQTVDLQFSITDTGIGIAQEQRSIIFDRFGQADSGIARKYGGTGLGLAIVQMILQALGSSLQLESSPGNGSRFYFHLEFEKGGEAATILEAPVSNERLAGIRVLVVDDNEINRMLAEKLLQRWGATVDGAADGEEGVRKAQSSAYDVILMDLQMPGMDIRTSALSPARHEDERVVAGLRTRRGDVGRSQELACAVEGQPFTVHQRDGVEWLDQGLVSQWEVALHHRQNIRDGLEVDVLKGRHLLAP
jgi:hypothetical protein